MNIVLELKPNPDSNEEIKKILAQNWGSESIVSKGKITDASKISRIVVKENKNIVGLATFLIDMKNHSCELISVDALQHGKGIGTKMIKLVEKTAKENGAKKLWLITTNDNYDAAIFYIKNRYRLINIHKNALDISRKLKPQIPTKGKYGIPLQDEWEFEKTL